MEKLERTRRVLNRISEPLRSDEPEPTEEEARAVEALVEPGGILDCVDPDDPANT